MRKYFPLLFSKPANGGVATWRVWTEGADVCTTWGKLKGKQQTARFSCFPKNVGRANATTAEQQAIIEAEALWEKKQKAKYHPDPKHWDSNVNLKPMLACKYEKGQPLEFPVYLQPKLDGLRCLAYTNEAGEIVLQSRGGEFYQVSSVLEGLEEIQEILQYTGDVLDGELYCHGLTLQEINSLVRRPQEGSSQIQFHVYDVFTVKPENAHRIEYGYKDRQYRVSQYFRNYLSGGSIVEVPTVEVLSEEALEDYHAEILRLGYEGSIIRLPGHPYRVGARSKGLLKVKDFQDAEFEVLGWQVGKGKAKDIPIFTLEIPNTGTFEATLKGSAAERKAAIKVADTWIGKPMTVRYFRLSDDGVPLLPVAIGIRED